MRRIVYFMHVSLDGFVTDPAGGMDWITVDDEIFDYAGDRTTQADLAIYGRVTFEMMDGYWPTAADSPEATKHDKEHSAWYKKVTKVVMSRTMKEHASPLVTILSDDIKNEVEALKKKAGNEIIIFGSPSSAHTLMSFGLVDDFWLFVNPVVLGGGIPLFEGIKDRVKLNLMTTHAFKSGVVCLHYEKV